MRGRNLCVLKVPFLSFIEEDDAFESSTFIWAVLLSFYRKNVDSVHKMCTTLGISRGIQ